MTKKPEATGRVITIDVADIHPDPDQPRKHFDLDALNGLAVSIKGKGVLQAILVRRWPADDERWFDGGERTQPPAWQIVAGERRWRATCIAGLETIPALTCQLDNATDVLVAQVIENEEREDLGPLEKADGYARLVEDHGHTVEQIRAATGKSISTIRGLLKLRQLPERARKALDAGEMPAATAQLIARVPSAVLRERLTLHVLSGDDGTPKEYLAEEDIVYWRERGQEPLSYRQTKELIEKHFQCELKGAPFSQVDKKLLPEAGSCKECPKRVGNLQKADPDSYAGTRADVCMDPECYRRKVEASRRRLEDEASKNGATLMPDYESKRLVWAPGDHLVSGQGFVDLDSVWDLSKPVKRQQTYRQVVGNTGEVRNRLEAAIDPKGKLRYLLPTNISLRALVNAGLISDPNGKSDTSGGKANGKPAPGSPEHLNGLADRMGLPREQVAADHAAGRGPEPHDVQKRTALIAAGVLFEMGANNPEGLEGMEANGDSGTCAAWEALKVLCLAAAEDACEMGQHEHLRKDVLTLVDDLGGDEVTQGLDSFRSWIDRAKPAELIGFLLKAKMLEGWNAGGRSAARQALLDWAEMDWEQLQDQARRELTGNVEPHPKPKTSPATDHDAWVAEVCKPADAATEGRRTVRAKGASAHYEIAPLPDGNWALRYGLLYEGGTHHGHSAPWLAYPTRQDCLDRFLKVARSHFAAEKGHSEGQVKIQKKMTVLLGPDFVEPDPGR